MKEEGPEVYSSFEWICGESSDPRNLQDRREMQGVQHTLPRPPPSCQRQVSGSRAVSPFSGTLPHLSGFDRNGTSTRIAHSGSRARCLSPMDILEGLPGTQYPAGPPHRRSRSFTMVRVAQNDT